MKKRFESTYSKRNNLASVTIMSLKLFNEEFFCKIKKIIDIFAPKTLYFDFAVCEQNKKAIYHDLEALDNNSKCIVSQSKNTGRLAYESSVNYLVEILRIIVKYDLEESTFFEPKNFTWEQYLLDGTFGDKFYKYDIADAVFTVCSHEGFHFILFRTDIFDYGDIISKIEEALI